MTTGRALRLFAILAIAMTLMISCGGSISTSGNSARQSSGTSSMNGGSAMEAEIVARMQLYEEQEFVRVASYRVTQTVNENKMYIGDVVSRLPNGQETKSAFAGWYPSDPSDQ